MKQSLLIPLLLCLLLPLRAQKAYTPDNLPKVHIQNKYRYLCDPEGIISPAATDSIDRMLYRLEQQTGIETVVAVVPSIGEAECFDFCHTLLNSWGVGKKGRDNGLVILLVTDQRCIQFYTGYGLEGPLPDAICKRIQTRYMIPYLKHAGRRPRHLRPTGRLDGERHTRPEDRRPDVAHVPVLPPLLRRVRRSRHPGQQTPNPLSPLQEAPAATRRKPDHLHPQRREDGRRHLHLPALRTHRQAA